MDDYISTEEFENDIKQEKYDNVYSEMMKRTLKQVEKVAKIRHIELEESNGTDKFYNIQYKFKKSTIYFQNIHYLMKLFIEWEYDVEDDFLESKEQKLKRMIKLYNGLIKQISYYIEIEKEIKEKGFEALQKEKIEKLIETFKQMLEYKNKTYDENWNFKEWIDKVSTYYNFYYEQFTNVLDEIEYGYRMVEPEIYTYDSIQLNEIEKIIELNDLYENLNYEGDDYKNYAYFYKDFELEEGQTYKDLYNNLEEKLINLFKEMLDYANAQYDKNKNSFNYIEWKVQEIYPAYNDVFIHFDALKSRPDTSYIQLLDNMEEIYNNLSKNYKKEFENN